MTIEAHQDLQAYFHGRLGQALKRRALCIAAHTEFYLVQLLNRALGTAAVEAISKPFVQRLADGVEIEDTGKRLRHFREMGDDALYVCGFFSDHLRGRGISKQYVATMGGSAYREASGLARWSAESQFSETFLELAARFETFATVLDDVREETSMRTPQDIIRLYDRWRQTGSPILAERLRDQGVFPQIPDDDETVH